MSKEPMSAVKVYVIASWTVNFILFACIGLALLGIPPARQ